MGLFEHWPYTNFHELNLNWIIEQIKPLKDSIAQAIASAAAAKESEENAAESAESAEQSALEASAYADGGRGALMCVSTYRDDVRDNAYEYYLALSYDGGTSWTEIDESRNFANLPMGSDVMCFPYGDGFLFLATGFSISENRDFYAVYTEDFETYTRLSADLGFIRKSVEYMGPDAYVWAPNIADIDGDLYVTAGVGYSATTESEIYTDPSSQRWVKVFTVKVTIDLENREISAVGSPFELLFENDVASKMDASLCKYNGYVYCIYKDRIYNVVNIAKSLTINGVFEDVQTALGGDVCNEAGYLLPSNGVVRVFWDNYNPRPYNQAAIMLKDDSIINTRMIGCVNTKHFIRSTGLPAGMRNPYPCVVTGKTVARIIKRYDVKAVDAGEYVMVPSTAYSIKHWDRSAALHTKYGKYLNIPLEIYAGVRATEEGQTGYFSNHDLALFIPVGINEVGIYTPYRSERSVFGRIENTGGVSFGIINGRGYSATGTTETKTKDYTLSNGWILRVVKQNRLITYYQLYGLSTSETADMTVLGTLDNDDIPHHLVSITIDGGKGAIRGVLVLLENGSIRYEGDSSAPNGTRAKHSCVSLGL